MFCLPNVVHYIIQINILNTEYVVALRDKANHERISNIEGSSDRTKVGLLCRSTLSMSLNIVYVL